ncbi:MAG: hypothetical protein ACRESR_02020 [Gammaproteobacteria bacterium]
MKKCLLGFLGAVVLVAAGTSTARADSWVEVGVDAWNTQISGYLSFPKSLGPDQKVYFRDDLNMGRRWNPNFYFAWHNSVPFLPDLRLEYGNLLSDGSTSLGNVCYDGIHYHGEINGQIALKLARILFYWNPIDNSVLDLRVGVDFRWVSLNTAATGSVKESAGVPPGCPTISLPARTASPVAGGDPAQTTILSKSKSAGVVTWLPEANLGLTVHLPGRFDILFEGSGVPYASSYLYDFRLGFQYRFASGLIFGVGYRHWRLHLDNTDWSVNGNLDFKGPYASVAWRF